jgi:hypothetical protein
MMPGCGGYGGGGRGDCPRRFILAGQVCVVGHCRLPPLSMEIICPDHCQQSARNHMAIWKLILSDNNAPLSSFPSVAHGQSRNSSTTCGALHSERENHRRNQPTTAKTGLLQGFDGSLLFSLRHGKDRANAVDALGASTRRSFGRGLD